MKKRGNGVIILLIICIFVALCAGLFGGYKYYELKNNDDSEVENNKNNDYNGEIIQDADVKVIEYINYSIDKTGITKSCGQKLGNEAIIIPMLSSNRKGVLELNSAIKEDLKHLIAASNRTEEEALNSDAGYSSSYGYIVNEDYITLHIVSGGGRYCGTGSSSNYYYTYDNKNDNYLTKSELLVLYNVSIDNLKSRIKNDIDTKHSNDEFGFYNRIITNLDQGNYQAYVNSDGNLILEFRYTLEDTLTYTYWKN